MNDEEADQIGEIPLITDKFATRFVELEEESNSMPVGDDPNRSYFDRPEIWQKWATSAESLIKAVFGEKSPHYENFNKGLQNCKGLTRQIRALQGIFQSAKEAFDGGYVFNVELEVSGEIFGDFVVLAKQSLAEGHKDVAAVLASAALEDALKRHATISGLDVTNSTLAQVIGALKSKGLVSGARKSMLDAMLKIRNSAMHADWEKVTEPDVNSIVGFVEQFLLSEFSSG